MPMLSLLSSHASFQDTFGVHYYAVPLSIEETEQASTHSQSDWPYLTQLSPYFQS